MLTNVTECPHCGHLQMADHAQIVDRVSGQTMPRPTGIIGSFSMGALGVMFIASSMSNEVLLRALLMIAGASMIALAGRIMWLLLFGEPVARFDYACAECGHTWQQREDQRLAMG
jgi:hypothetical protein